ncbi:N-acetylmuramoyl-L-alanine amidase AmiD [bacterium HR40]|nr:N-acetylmuramoyl-L-alanine amidase AmiD [bacterium HR40]
MRVRVVVSPNFDRRQDPANIRLVVLHYTGMPDAASALRRLCDPASRVSAHYLIDEDGTIYSLVPEPLRAWHAGVSAWREWNDPNSVSIGIELVNPGHDFGYRPFPAAQIDALCALLERIRARHPIAPRDIVGHSDIAPARKRDPGELFPWVRLAARGLAIWPTDAAAVRPVDPLRAAHLLRCVGYRRDLPDTGFADCIRAFQRRFRPERVDGVLDGRTMALLEGAAGLSQEGGLPIFPVGTGGRMAAPA